MNWYNKQGSGGQGIVIDEADGRTVAIAYDAKDAALIAAAPELLEALHALQVAVDLGEARIPAALGIGISNAVTKAVMA
jgi:hypothetical protein